MPVSSTNTVRTVVIGTGAMAPGIAAEYARLGPTAIAGRDTAKTGTALAVAHTYLTMLETAGLLPDAETARGNLSGVLLAAADYAGATMVVESITEDLPTKRTLFAMLDAATPTTTLLCSNTSSLRITAIAEGLAHPERVLGTHYWNPPPLMPLVEVIPGEQTDPAHVETVRGYLVRMDKQPVQVRREVPGFIWNRLQNILVRECLWLVANGVATQEDIDLILERGLGRRWSLTGPFTSVKLGGPHVYARVAEELFPEFTAEPSFPDGWRDILMESRPDLDLTETRAMRERALVALLQRDHAVRQPHSESEKEGAGDTALSL